MSSTSESVTTWTRFEPRCRTEDINKGLEARIHDPLWLLARQWQMGEFRAEDAGSPVSARIRGRSYRLTHYSPGVPEAPLDAIAYDSTAMPLEMLVEQEDLQLHSDGEDYDPIPQLQAVVETGQHLLRLLALAGGQLAQVRANLIQCTPYRIALPPDEILAALDARTTRTVRLSAGRIPDGIKLYTRISTALDGGLPGISTFLAELGVSSLESSLLTSFQTVATAWTSWYLRHYTVPTSTRTPPPAWRQSRMEYQCSIGAAVEADTPTEITAVAREYAGGRLDWYSFDATSTPLEGTPGLEPQVFCRTMIPKGVRYHGMPASRWWEFEDADINFGSTGTSPEDETGMLLTEFAISYGNDWSQVPLRLPVGSFTEINSLVVTDSFGVRMLIKPAGEASSPDWRMFQLDWEVRDLPQSNRLPYLYLPPTLPRLPETSVIESVVLLRDEGANMAWALEEKVQGPAGGVIDRAEAWWKNRGETPPPSSGPEADLKFTLLTTVPDYWLPLLPRKNLVGNSIRLILGQMPSSSSTSPTLPQGRLLQELDSEGNYIEEEEIPREGVRLTRVHKNVRWANGETYRWIGRRKTIGRGTGSSGLRFDVLKPTQ